MLEAYLPKLKDKFRPQITIVNGENAAAGKGITEKIYKQFLNLGVQTVTLGNNTWNKREIVDFKDDAQYLIRLANFPENNLGKGIVYVKNTQLQIAIINLQGRTFLCSDNDSFKKADELIQDAKKRTNIIFIDFHAEATSEKQAFAWYVYGRVSAVVRTHTHIQTADERILPQGTAYISDVGMTGSYDGIIGFKKEAIIKRFTTNMPTRFEVEEEGRNQLSGCLITIDQLTGKATEMKRILINDDHPFYE